MNALDDMEPDNEEEGDAKEPSSEEDQDWFGDPELELNADEEALAALDAYEIGGAQAMDSEESESESDGSSSEASSVELSDTSDFDWAP